MEKIDGFIPKSQKEENRTAGRGPPALGCPPALHGCTGGHGNHSRHIPQSVYSLSFPNYKERGLDVKEDKQRLRKRLSSGTAL